MYTVVTELREEIHIRRGLTVYSSAYSVMECNGLELQAIFFLTIAVQFLGSQTYIVKSEDSLN